MSVVPFARPDADRLILDITYVKGEYTRRFWIRPGKVPHSWWGQIFFNTTQHRVCIAEHREGISRFYREVQREMAALERDGWVQR